MLKKILLALVCVCFLSAGYCVLTLALEEKSSQGDPKCVPVPDNVEYILISSDNLLHVNQLLRGSIKTILPEAQEHYFEYTSPEAKKYIKEMDIKFIPVVIYSGSITAADNFFHMVKHKMIDKVKGCYIIPPKQLQMGETMLLERKREDNKLYVFVRSLCPYAKDEEAEVFDFIRDNNLDIDVQVCYVVDMNEFGMSSPGGVEEIRENIRRVVIQKYYPDKFQEYLSLVRTKKYEDVLSLLGLSEEDIDKRKQGAVKILEKDTAAARNLDIQVLPAFLWENIYLIPNRETLKQHLKNEEK